MSNIKTHTRLNRNNLWLAGIFLLAVILRYWLCTTDAFLHEWDERYHALVAKNLLLHPLKPTLYDIPLLDYDYRDWASNHIWLSKPILPLWCIALSLKFWGFTEWAVRFPSLIFSLGSVWLTFKIAEHLYGRKVALWAAFFHAIHGFTLEVAAGRFSSDHVETIFLFWMELGFWTMIKYYLTASNASKWRYAVGLGATAGLAFMSKWTGAFMLPIVWLAFGLLWNKKISARWLRDLALMSGVFLAIVSPWLVYIFQHYPREASSIFNGIFIPVKDTIQGHSGAWYFYLNEVRMLFGEIIYLPMLWLLYVTVKTLRKPAAGNFNRLIMACWIFIPLVLLSLAATKRSNYILPAAPAFFILTALFMRFIWQKRHKLAYGKIMVPIIWAALVLLPIRYSIERSKVFFQRETNPAWAQQLKELALEQPESVPKTVIFNEPHAIEAMFYTGFVAYNWMPTPEKINQLKNEGWRVLEYQNGLYIIVPHSANDRF